MIVIINSSSSLFQGAYLLGIKLVFIWHCFAFVFFGIFISFFCMYVLYGSFCFVFVFVYIRLLFCEVACLLSTKSGLCVIVFQVDTNSGDSWWSLVPGICNFYLYLYSVHCIWICICTCKCICIVFVTLEVDNNPYMILPLARYIISTHKQLSIAAIAFLREQHQSYQKEKNLTPAKAVWRDICTPLFMYFPSTQQYLLPRPTKHFLSQVAYFSLDHLYLLPTFKWTTWIGNSWVWLFWVILSYAVFIFVYPAS